MLYNNVDIEVFVNNGKDFVLEEFPAFSKFIITTEGEGKLTLEHIGHWKRSVFSIHRGELGSTFFYEEDIQEIRHTGVAPCGDNPLKDYMLSEKEKSKEIVNRLGNYEEYIAESTKIKVYDDLLEKIDRTESSKYGFTA